MQPNKFTNGFGLYVRGPWQGLSQARFDYRPNFGTRRTTMCRTLKISSSSQGNSQAHGFIQNPVKTLNKEVIFSSFIVQNGFSYLVLYNWSKRVFVFGLVFRWLWRISYWQWLGLAPWFCCWGATSSNRLPFSGATSNISAIGSKKSPPLPPSTPLSLSALLLLLRSFWILIGCLKGHEFLENPYESLVPWFLILALLDKLIVVMVIGLLVVLGGVLRYENFNWISWVRYWKAVVRQVRI